VRVEFGEKAKKMKKWTAVVVVGILLILVSGILLAAYNLPVDAYTTSLAGPSGESTGDWVYAANFTANDIILVDIYQNLFWSQNVTFFDVIAGIPTLFLNVNITDPKNTVSAYQLQYTFQQSDVTHRLLAYNLTEWAVGTGINPKAPVTESGITFIAGVAKFNGTYVANITWVGSDVLQYRATSYKPGYFALWKAVAYETYPYRSLLYVSFATIPAGSIFVGYGLNKNNRKSKKRTKA
jgi:hypothetical protein